MNVPLLFELWFSDIKNAELAKKLGVSRARLWDIRKRYGLPPRRHERGGTWPRDPSPQEIEERAAEVRAGWSDEVRQNRGRGSKPQPWRPPVLSLDR